MIFHAQLTRRITAIAVLARHNAESETKRDIYNIRLMFMAICRPYWHAYAVCIRVVAADVENAGRVGAVTSAHSLRGAVGAPRG